ncbi:MAG: hypothetical protein ABR541_02445 [Candidatus Dormibacteria bacterium]
MPTPPRRVTVAAWLLWALSGALAGAATLAGCGALWRAGARSAASVAAEVVLLSALTAVAAATLLALPARQVRARIQSGRPLPEPWWPAADPVPTLAAWAGLPLAAGAGMAALLFR